MTKSSLFAVALLGFGTALSPHARAEPPRLEPPRLEPPRLEPPRLEPPRAPVTEEEPPLRLRLYGFAQLDYLQAFQGVDPAWQAAIRPSRIATDGRFGDSPEATLSVRQSRFGVETWAAIGSERLHGQFEIDLFGVGADEGQTTLRLRQAYGEWRGLLAGQANSVFMDGDVFPNFIEYWGPVGMVLYRNPQLRWTPWSG
ncbi:MAG TPA: DcaP family trimeric outer membrane transporter, partial [Polyangiaceae bacterium]|nr:DcaP family trimeric outer membrane transporter [Polyangiaceae bacterium]